MLQPLAKSDPGLCHHPIHQREKRTHLMNIHMASRQQSAGAGVGRKAASQGWVDEGRKRRVPGRGTPEAPPDLASPSLPQSRFSVVHSETGLDWQRAMVDRCPPRSAPALARTHRAGKRERRKIPFPVSPSGTGKPLLWRGKGERPSLLTSPRLLSKGHSLLAQKFLEHLGECARHYSQLEKGV